MRDVYYHYKGYRGDRYFRMLPSSLKVIQVVLSAGEVKKGRGAMLGIYFIDRQTLAQNYFFHDGIEPCTQTKYNKAFNKALKMLA